MMAVKPLDTSHTWMVLLFEEYLKAERAPTRAGALKYLMWRSRGAINPKMVQDYGEPRIPQ